MASPIKPNDFKALIPEANANICTKFNRLFQLPKMLYQFWSWMMDTDGIFSSEFKAAVGVFSDTLPAPTGVTASENANATDVNVTWIAVSGATYYQVWRGTTDDVTQATRLPNDATSTAYTDTPPASSTLYHYWVKAFNTTAESPFSEPDTGSAGTTGQASNTVTITETPANDAIWTYPGVTTTTATITVYGGGGGGGKYVAAPKSTWGTPFDPEYQKCFDGAGGGGSGGKVATTNVTLTAGESLKITVGKGGDPGQAGGDTFVIRSDDSVITYVAGGLAGAITAGGKGGSGGNDGDDGTDHVGLVSDDSCEPGDHGSGGAAVDGYGAGGDGGEYIAPGTATLAPTAGTDGAVVIAW